ncbi:MAG: hypothetical protein KGV51_07775 [Moraxellaceae bacterium]|nr:hypothetical protein [Moraxellaceae bacterium]
MLSFQKLLLGSTLAIIAVSASAGTAQGKHGHIGYDTAAECNQAIANGTAKFYKAFTNKKPLLRKGEASVEVTTLGKVSPEYAKGSCDLGTGRRGGRDGVEKALQGKYIAYSPDTEVNAYLDSDGNLLRISVRKCDNWFSGDFPTPFKAPYVAPPPPPAPVVTTPPPAPVVATPPPVVTPPPVAPVAPAVQAATGSANAIPMIAAGVAGIAAIAAIVNNGDDDKSGTTGSVPSK